MAAATVIVELTGDERRVLESYRKAEEADRKLRESTGKTGDAGAAASKLFSQAWVEAGKGAVAGMDQLLRELRKTGPEGQQAAAAVEGHFRETGKAGRRSMQEIVDAIGGLDEEAKKAAIKAAADLQEADRQSEFKATLASIGKLGPEGEKIAKGIIREMDKAASQSAGGMDKLVAKLGELNPTAAQAAERIKAELAKADAQTKFDNSLEELRKINPAAAKAASAVLERMEMADDEVKFDNIISELRKVDPVAAEEARKLRRHMRSAADDSTSAFKGFGSSAIGQVTSIAAAYVSIERAIDAVIAANRKVIDTNREVLESLRRQESGDRQLLQVAQGAEDFGALRTKADSLSKEYGISREQARTLVASARRESFEKAIDFIASNQQVMDVDVQTELASKIPAIFKSEGITAQQSINAALVAANRSSVKAEELARAIPVASEGAALAGATAAETLAVTAGISDKFNTPQVSADRVKALAMKISLDRGDTGKSPEKMAKLIEAEDDRVERAEQNFRTLNERVSDLKADLEEEKKKPRTTAAEIRARDSRLADLQRDLSRAERAVNEFDKADLERKEIKNDPPRASLQGKALIEGVKALQAMTDEQRKDVLGTDAESNTAYELIARNLAEIEAIKQEVEKQIALTGTGQSSIAIKQAVAATDPRMAAIAAVAKSKNALEITREEQRAVEEAKMQRDVNTSLQGAENSDASQFSIALAENITEGARGFGLKPDPAKLIPQLTGSSLQLLQRDLQKAVDGGDRSAERPLLAAQQLQKSRITNKDAILSPIETAELMSTEERKVDPADVGIEQQTELTNAILEQANRRRGKAQRNPLFRSLGIGDFDPEVQGADASVKILEAIDRQTAAIERQNEMMERQTNATVETAANTRPGPAGPVDYDSVLSASMEEQDARTVDSF